MVPLATSATVYLIDAHGLIYQMFHGLRAPMTSPDGRPTNAVFGVTRALLSVRDRQPDYLICAFDRPTPTFRSRLDPNYKAHRPPPPDDLQLQLPMIEAIIRALRLPILALDGYEADDVMATVARAAAERGDSVFLCTADKDCRQLISDRIRLLNLKSQQTLDRDALIADWGVAPEQVVDFQALIGDSVDNIPGVPGIGAKTAAKLLQEFGSLDAIYQRLDEVNPRRIRDQLRDHHEAALRSRALVRLDTQVPIPLDWDSWRLREPNVEATLALFQEYGFRAFHQRIRTLAKAAHPVPVTVSTGPAGLFDSLNDELFPFGANVENDEPAPSGTAVRSDWKADYGLVASPSALEAFLRELRSKRRFAFDVETTGLDPFTSQLVGLAFCWSPGLAFYLPLRGPVGETVLDETTVLAALKPIFEDAAVMKVNHNIKFDVQVLAQHGIQIANVAGDSMLAHYLLHSGELSHSLDELASKYLHHDNIKITDLIGKKGKAQLTLDQVPVEKVGVYACEDADVAWQLTDQFERELHSAQLRPLYDDLEVPLIGVLAEMERIGIRLDTECLRRLSGTMTEQLRRMEERIYELAGHPFNIASLKQLRVVLFDELKLPVQKRTDITNEPSTDQETLEKLALLHELPRLIVEHRQISKLLGTYVDALPAMVHPQTGRLHTSFNQTVAATGRLSSSEPNLQNIPMRTDMGREIRQAFLPAKGWHLLSADYSQVELRLLAHFCEDDNLRQAFAENRDVHAAVAARIFGVAEDNVTPAQRRMAKTVNFGVIYGISAHGLATRLGIPRSQAEQFIDDYFHRYPQVEAYQSALLRRCHKDGHVRTLLGRRRTFDRSAIRPSSHYQNRNQTEREAINMEIQGSAADLLKKAMLNVHRRLRSERLSARMLLTVHDELVLEVPPNECEQVAHLLRQEMSQALTLSVPLQVDVSVGPNWLEQHEWNGVRP